jgi:SHS2 domain-containing protein
MDAYWEHFEHQADIGVRGVAKTLAGSFEQAALAMMSVITDLDRISVKSRFEMQFESEDYDLLFYDWLNNVVFEMATRKMLFKEFKVQINNHTLKAIIGGEPVDQSKHYPAVEIKGATFTELSVRKLETGEWLAQSVIDV